MFQGEGLEGDEEMDRFSHWTVIRLQPRAKFQEKEARLGPSHLVPKPWELHNFYFFLPGLVSLQVRCRNIWHWERGWKGLELLIKQISL